MPHKNVILARPHPVLVDHMRAFLASSGFTSSLVFEVDKMCGLVADKPAGVIISTSTAVSHGSLMFRDMISAVRVALPGTPILVSTLVSFNHLHQIYPDLAWLPVEKATPDHSELGQEDCLVLLQRDDLIDHQRRLHASAIVCAHFR